MVTITWIVNNVATAGTRAEHGLAFWIETPGGQILFDTGGSGEVLLHNLEQLDIDPATADALVISHAHDDHTGGLADLLPLLRPGIPLYAQSTLFRQRYSRRTGTLLRRGMRIDQETLRTRLALCLDKQPREVLPGVWTTGEIAERPAPEGRSAHHAIRRGNQYVADPYTDDLSIVLHVQGGLFLLCGCCHAGLLNTIWHVQRTWQQPLVGIGGGVHLKGASVDTMDRTTARIAQMDGLQHLWLGHCSGDEFMQRASRAFPDRYRAGTSGQRLILPEA
jgi:7,8-dihydropterin-6-yl-methyl-4-(beta-D-ribofuranosyl)aminobenzene 5'-phosphate synthase